MTVTYNIYNIIIYKLYNNVMKMQVENLKLENMVASIAILVDRTAEETISVSEDKSLANMNEK